jgi:uncharacterized membrane protein
MTKEEFLALASQEWEKLSTFQTESSFYEYEKKFDANWINLGRTVLEASISQAGGDRRKKKNSKPLRSDNDIA